MYELHFRRDYENREDYVCLASGSLMDVIAQRKVSGDLVVNTVTKRCVQSDYWLFPWEKNDSSCYAQKAMRFDRLSPLYA